MTKKQKKSPAFQFYPSDFLGSPKVRAMNLAEIGLYVVGMCLDWEHDGLTKDELRDLAASQRATPKQFEELWKRVQGCFREKSGRLRNARLDEERAKQKAWRRKSSKGGKIGSAKRWSPPDKGGVRVVTPTDDTLSPSPIPTPITTKATTRAASRADTRPPESWLLPVQRSYESRKGDGTFPFPKAGKLLKPLREAGHSGDEIAVRLGRYIDWLDDPKYLSLQKFRETFGDYAEEEPAAIRALKGYPNVVDETGVFTEYGERVTRPRHLKIA